MFEIARSDLLHEELGRANDTSTSASSFVTRTPDSTPSSRQIPNSSNNNNNTLTAKVVAVVVAEVAEVDGMAETGRVEAVVVSQLATTIARLNSPRPTQINLYEPAQCPGCFPIMAVLVGLLSCPLPKSRPSCQAHAHAQSNTSTCLCYGPTSLCSPMRILHAQFNMGRP